MEAFSYKGISDGKYVEGDIEALNVDEASHKLKEQIILITNLIRSAKKTFGRVETNEINSPLCSTITVEYFVLRYKFFLTFLTYNLAPGINNSSNRPGSAKWLSNMLLLIFTLVIKRLGLEINVAFNKGPSIFIYNFNIFEHSI